MAQAQYRTLSKRVLDRLSVNGKDAIFWDHDLAGFGIRVYPTGKKVFVVQTRAFGRSKRVTLGRYPELTPDAARKNASAVIARIKKGEPPVPPEPAPVPTVADLAERYQREYVEMHCKPTDDRQAPRSPKGPDDRPLRPSCTGFGEGRRREGFG